MIETQRLTVRRFTAGDWKDLYEYLSDPKVVIFEPYEVFSEDECKREAARRSGDDAFWAVCLKQNQKLIGNIYLVKQDFDTWELGYVFNSSY
ncbi:MAG TPA: GNAT family N-acetyltransferase, partial [Clostridia bacterium]|nr:GNAT family N-acetyltransferase [Clostridia bacterium]